jgi:hypothetical protein
MNANSDGSHGIPGLPGYSLPVLVSALKETGHQADQGATLKAEQGDTIKAEPNTVGSANPVSLVYSFPPAEATSSAALEASIPVGPRPEGPPKAQGNLSKSVESDDPLTRIPDVVKLNYGQG